MGFFDRCQTFSFESNMENLQRLNAQISALTNTEEQIGGALSQEIIGFGIMETSVMITPAVTII